MVNKIIISFLFVFIISGCASTRIYVAQSDVNIEINGIKHGKGVAYIPRTGIPKKAEIKAYHRNKEVGHIVIHRRIDIITVLAGMYTYGLGFIFVWRFPKEVEVPIYGVDPFEKQGSIWDQPPGQRRD